MVRSPSSAILADRAPPGRGSDRIRRAGGELATRRSRRSSAGCSRVSSRAGPAITADHEKAVKHRRRSNHGTDLGSGSDFNHLKGSAAGSGSRRADESVSLSVLFARRRSVQGQRCGFLFPARRSSPFLSPSCSREDDRLVARRLVPPFHDARRECSRILPELFPWELPLPWAPLTLSQETAVCPERGDLARGSACAKGADASTSRDAGTSATARTRSACGKSTAGKRPAARRNVARTPASRPSTPRPRSNAVSAPRPRPRPLRTRKLRPRVVTQQKIFSSPLMRSARLPPTPRELIAQPGSLLRRRLPPGRSQRPGPRT